LSTAVFSSKSSAERRRAVEMAAAGQGLNLRGMQQGGSVVDFGEHPDRIHSPGPNAAHYEQFRSQANAHLIFNAFWNIQHFCVFQMLMRDPMHQVDLGAIVHLIRAILRKFKECVETVLGMPGLAARKLGHRLELMLAKRSSRGGQR
jgi:hypothetical protein